MAALAGPAGAWGFRAGEWGTGLRLGLDTPLPTNRLDAATRPGAAVGLHVFRNSWDWLSLGIETDYLTFPKRRGPLIAGRAPERHIGGRAMAALATARVNLVFDQPWTLYVKGGGGVHHLKANVETAGERNDNSWGDVILLGAGGLEIFTVKNMSVELEARFQSLRLDAGRFGIDTAEFLSYQLGLNYWFGQR